MTIIIFSSPGDYHVEEVSSILEQNGASCVQFDLESFPKNLQLGIRVNNTDSTSYLFDGKTTYDFNNISAVWYRDVLTPKLLKPVRHDTESYIQAESVTFLEGLHYLRPDLFWLATPIQNQLASIKIRQTQLALQLGFKIPDTCIGNQTALADMLIQENNTLALKTLYRNSVEFELSVYQKFLKFIYNIKNRKLLEKYRNEDPSFWQRLQYRNRQTIYTTQFKRSEASSYLTRIPVCPVILQEYIPKKLELRITVVGKKIFPCAIYSQDAPTDEGRIDWRGHEDHIRHEPYVLPSEIEQKCFKLVKSLGLQFGAIDMIVTPNDEYIFLEINPNGQWLWIEKLTGMPISNAVAELLITRDGI